MKHPPGFSSLYWLTITWNLWNKHHWKLNWNIKLFILRNTFENTCKISSHFIQGSICKMLAILYGNKMSLYNWTIGRENCPVFTDVRHWWEPCNTDAFIFLPRQILAFGYCRCLCLCVCVCMCQSQACPLDNMWPFKLGSPNVNQRCKIPLVNSLKLSDTYMLVNSPSLLQIMACRLVGTKPLSEPVLKN